MRKVLFCFVWFFLSMSAFAIQETDFSMEGASQQEKTADREIWLKPDGTVITVYSDRSEATFPDKSKIIKFNDGRRESIAPDGSKVSVDEAKGTRTYSGKTNQSISFEGKTPFGERIERVEKKVLRDPVLVRMIYVPERSDEILYAAKTEEAVELEIQVFFDALYDAMRQKYIQAVNEKKPLPSSSFDLLISYCRYCKTGYCFGKERKVVVQFYENGSVVKTFEYDGILLRDKGKVKEFVARIVESAG